MNEAEYNSDKRGVMRKIIVFVWTLSLIVLLKYAVIFLEDDVPKPLILPAGTMYTDVQADAYMVTLYDLKYNTIHR